jgi:hypothetical protein
MYVSIMTYTDMMYTDTMSLKFQITLPDSLMADLKRESSKAGVSVAELIRQSVAERLRQKPARSRQDPFDSIDGLANSGETALAASVDDILYR